MQSLSGKRDPNILFVVFIIVVLVNTETVTSFINYSDERHDEKPLEIEPGEARTTRHLLESSDIWKSYKSRYTLQEATEHFLQYGALLRNQILDTFGALVYDHYDDYSIGQTEALYRVYHETLERKYNLFNIVPSVLADPDTRPTKICRHIHKHVHTCLKESSQLCATIKKHDNPHPHSASSSAVNVTRRVYRSARLRKQYPNGFSLPAVLEYLKGGTLKLTVGLLFGLLHNVQYDSFDDEIRTAEKNVMTILMSEMKGANEHQPLMRRDQIQRIHTISELIKLFFETRRAIYEHKKGKNFAVLAEHVVREVEAISQNIELFGLVYENNTIHMKFLFNLVLPPDVVDSDITEAKDYLLRKIDDYDIVKKYLKIEKYQQSGPDQLLMEILGQMRDINFAVDIATALHSHARFWHQSHMVKNLNELLELFDAYENLRMVKKFSPLMSLVNEVRDSLWDSKNVSIEILCHNPRACLRLGLETVARCSLINSETKERLQKLFSYLSQDGSIYADNCKLPIIETETNYVPETTHSPTTVTEDMISEFYTRKRLDSTEASTVETSTPKSTERSAPTTDEEISTSEPTITTARPETKRPKAIIMMAEHTTGESAADIQWKPTEYPTETSTAEEIAATTVTLVSTKAVPQLMREIMEETVTPKLIIEEPTTVMLNGAQETTTERLTTPGLSTIREVARIMTEQTTERLTTEEQDDMIHSVPTTEEPTTKLPTMMIGGNLVRGLVKMDETTPPATDDDCYDGDCTSEEPEASTDMSARAWTTNMSGPPILLENLRSIVVTNLPTALAETTTTTTTPTTTTRETPAAREMITYGPETSSKSTTATAKIPGLSKKPKSYSVSASGEDCSGEGCSSSECSGDGCPSLSSPEAGSMSTECTDRNSAGCSPESNGDCSNEGCTSTTTPSEEREENCIGDGCFPQSTAQSSPECIGDDCSRDLILSSSAPNCPNNDCSEPSRSHESNCNGTECLDDNQKHPSTARDVDKTPYNATTPPWIKCDNKDPHHQRRLHRLAKVRMMNVLHATVPIPTVHSPTDVGVDISTVSHSKFDRVSSTASPPSSLIEFTTPKKDLMGSSHDLRPLMQNFQHKETPVLSDRPRPAPWFLPPPNPTQTHKIPNHKTPDQSDEAYEEEEDVSDSEMEPNYSNTNMNINTNFFNLRRYRADKRRTADRSSRPVLQVRPPSKGYRRVMAKVFKPPVSTRGTNESPRLESGAGLREAIEPTGINSEAHGRPRVSFTRLSPALYQRRSEDEVGVVRKKRSIIRAPQRAKQRDRVL